MRKFLLGLLLLIACALDVNAASRFAVCTVTCTWDASSTAMWSASSGGATGASAPGSSDTVTFDAATCVGGVTCTATVAANVNVTSITMGACTASTTGCIIDFATNDNNVTTQTFSGTGTGTRNITLGDGTWTLTGTSGTVWDMGTTTNLTFNANSSTIDIAATAVANRAFSGGSLNYNTFKITNPTSNAWKVRLTSGTSTWANWVFNANTRYVEFASNQTQTITGTITFDCATAAACLFIGDGLGNVTTLSVANANTLSWLGIQNITKAGAGSITANNSLNFGGNTLVTINQPSGSAGGSVIGGF